MIITEFENPFAQNRSREASMPILMLALMALVAFGLIGVLLFTAGTLERKTKKTPAVPEPKPTP